MTFISLLHQHGWYLVVGYALGALPRLTAMFFKVATLREKGGVDA